MADVRQYILYCVVADTVFSYVHGGAWRDPEVDSKSFQATVDNLWQSPLKSRIEGFASINYRLSPYPSHPRLPSSPDDPSRNVHDPSHVEDLAAALSYLNKKYNIDGRYLLIGHSAGATMAFQVRNATVTTEPLPQPLAVLGVSGIYEFNAFVEYHKQIPAYDELTVNAFPERQKWAEDSPSSNQHPLGAIWETARAVIISHSKQDELVEAAQATYMLDRARNIFAGQGGVSFVEATGAHNDIWKSGHILAGVIVKSLNILKQQV